MMVGNTRMGEVQSEVGVWRVGERWIGEISIIIASRNGLSSTRFLAGTNEKAKRFKYNRKRSRETC